tara:strand:+ start:7220 stop:7573 length:354 start_codon:yes stop_codon:yes gene_type:complete
MSIAKGAIRGISAAMKAAGGAIIYRRVTTGIYNSVNGSVSEVKTDIPLKGIVSNVSRSEVSDLISAQDKRVRISAGDIDFTPTTFDRVVINNIEYKIIQINTTEQDNTNIAFNLFLR